jgi:hypothetical protein
MPLVRVRYASEIAFPRPLSELGALVRSSVASILDCDDPGGHLTPIENEVFFERYSDADQSEFDLFVDIEAVRFPSRAADLNARVRRLGHAILGFVGPHVRFGLRVKLVDAPGWFDSRDLSEAS